jgi:hypothetical protein
MQSLLAQMARHSPQLGRVDELFDDKPHGDEMNQSQKGLAQFLIPRSNASKLLEVVEEPFHLLTSFGEVFIIGWRYSTIALWWDHRPHVMLDEVLSDVLTVIGLVQHGMAQRWLWRHLREHSLQYGTLMTSSGCQDDGDAGAFIETARMDVGGPAAPRAAQSRRRLPPVFFSRTSGMLMGAHHRRSDKEVARPGTILRLEVLPEPAPAPTHFPAAKAVVHRVPASTILRQVAPGQSCAGAIQHGLDQQAIPEPWRTASAGFQGGEEGGNFHPRLISEP